MTRVLLFPVPLPVFCVLRVCVCELVRLASHARAAVLVGEASHGTDEFYAGRAALTRGLVGAWGEAPAALVLELGAAPAARLDAFVQGTVAALEWDARFPAWLWNNAPTRRLLAWLRRQRAQGRRLAVVGMDLYQDDESRRYLRDHNVVEPRFESRDEWLNALVVQHAADYKASGNSWNVRDSHMHEVVQYMLMQGYRVIMHAHNSHVLDARAHSRAERGEVSAIVSFTDSLTHKASG